MSDVFAYHGTGMTSPANSHYRIVPSNTTDLPVRPRAIYVESDGTAVLRDEDGVDVSYELIAGTTIPMRAIRVLATGTTANLIAWY